MNFLVSMIYNLVSPDKNQSLMNIEMRTAEPQTRDKKKKKNNIREKREKKRLSAASPCTFFLQLRHAEL